MTNRLLLGAAAACLALASSVLLVPPSGAADVGFDEVRDAAPDKVGFYPDEDGKSALRLDDGDRFRVAVLDRAGHRLLQPLPQEGPRSGVRISSGKDGTTVQAMAGSSRPAVVERGTTDGVTSPADGLVALHLDAVGRDGRDAGADVTIFDVEKGAVLAHRRLSRDSGEECTNASGGTDSCVLLPRGTYSVMAFVRTNPAYQPAGARLRTIQNLALVGDPQLALDRDRSFTLDARLAEPVVVRTPGHRTEVRPGGAMRLGFYRTAANGVTQSEQVYREVMLDETFYMQPTEQVSLGSLKTLARLRLEAPDIAITAPGAGRLQPEYYEPVWFSGVSAQFPVFDGVARMRVVDAGRGAPDDLEGLDLHGALAVVERSDDRSVAEQSNALAAAGARMVAVHNDGPGDNAEPGGKGTRLRVPTVRLTRAEGAALEHQATALVRGESASPYVYDLVLKERGAVPSDLTYLMPTSKLAEQVRRFYGQPTTSSTFVESAYAFQPEDRMSFSYAFPLRGGPRTRLEYRLPDPETRWSYGMSTPEVSNNPWFPSEPLLPMTLGEPTEHVYNRPDSTEIRAAAAPITPQPKPLEPIRRYRDLMLINIAGFVDADGNWGRARSTDTGMRTWLEVSVDGVSIGGTSGPPQGIARLPQGRSTVQIRFESENRQAWNELSTDTETVWTFPSMTTSSDTTQPVILADYDDVDVDLHNRTDGHGRDTSFTLDLTHPEGAAASPITRARMSASYDDGRTWTPTSVTPTETGGYAVRLPPGKGFVSLRLHAEDSAGAVLDQTVIRAWYVGS